MNLERKSVSLQREFRIAEKSYGADHLDLVITNGYVSKLLGNAKVVSPFGATSPRHPDRISKARRDRNGRGLEHRWWLKKAAN